jgi:hypothetical protein
LALLHPALQGVALIDQAREALQSNGRANQPFELLYFRSRDASSEVSLYFDYRTKRVIGSAGSFAVEVNLELFQVG